MLNTNYSTQNLSFGHIYRTGNFKRALKIASKNSDKNIPVCIKQSCAGKWFVFTKEQAEACIERKKHLKSGTDEVFEFVVQQFKKGAKLFSLD